MLVGAALMLFALVAVTTVAPDRHGGVQCTLPAAVESRDLRFGIGQDGAVLVFDAAIDQLVDTLAPGSNGFVRVVLRGLARERKLGDIGAQPPFRLTRYADGQITLDRHIDRQADRPRRLWRDQSEAFARLLNRGAQT